MSERTITVLVISFIALAVIGGGIFVLKKTDMLCHHYVSGPCSKQPNHK